MITHLAPANELSSFPALCKLKKDFLGNRKYQPTQATSILLEVRCQLRKFLFLKARNIESDFGELLASSHPYVCSELAEDEF